jgi:predicted AlkP superfamily phosphohydrolase/phosphomutase
VVLSAALLSIGCSEPRVLVVGLDGANWTVLDPLIEAGHLPNIGHLVENGARAHLACAPADPPSACFCPPVWTSIVTGVPLTDHHIPHFYTESTRRGVPAIWNLAAERGATVTTASWRGTWPPERGIEFVLTEPGLDVAAEQLYEAWGLDTEHPARRYPWTLFQPTDLLRLLDILPPDGERPPSWGIYARDRVAMQAVLALARRQTELDLEREYWEQPPELTMILIHGPDKISHLTWNFFQRVMYGPFDPTRLLADADASEGIPLQGPPFGWGNVADTYIEADRWLGELLAARHYDYVVFLSDHGMTRNPRQGFNGHHHIDALEAHRGIFAIYGPGIEPGAWLGEVSVLDVAPTLAYLMDIPVAEDLPGRVRSEAFSFEWQLWRPPSANTVPSWD